MKKLIMLLCIIYTLNGHAQNNPGSNHGNKFEQLGTILPSPSEYRTASGAPGPKYWQQKADYDIQCELDESALLLTGKETIIYYNNSPDVLNYLWFQLDENEHSTVNNAGYQYSAFIQPEITNKDIKKWEEEKTDNGYGIIINDITNAAGKKLNYTINRTMMRVDLPVTLLPHQQYIVKINWKYKITDRKYYHGRGGYEYFPEDGNYLFTMTQWYPRLCVYTDYTGWENHQFADKEFCLGFGNFKVRMTVPADHMVGATGECQNYQQNLSAAQWLRWQKAQTVNEPFEIVTLPEALAAEKTTTSLKKTWIFKAENVRDFAWTSSPKFIWDAMPITIDGKKIMCMSFYGKEAYPLYHKYSTKLIAHTLKIYSGMTIPYPYPVAQSVEADNGMEYPMIAFNLGRAEKDGSYSEKVKNDVIEVIIHEVGHNFFPMIINTNERRWSWMDEGFNSYIEYMAEKAWDPEYPSRHGPIPSILKYMQLPKNELEPIMTDPHNMIHYGPNTYYKTAVAMNILRETILGPALFDFAFKTYAKRWAFKQPTPADFFRTMEDATATDLDWFWRGWFYSTDVCDMAIDSVKHFKSANNNDKYFYELSVSNKGGLCMPLIIQWNYTDGTKETDYISAYIWRLDEQHMVKAFMKNKEVKSVVLDPENKTADVDQTNNQKVLPSW
jgi:hypothetical protein